jgi:hypothetical protein
LSNVKVYILITSSSHPTDITISITFVKKKK